MSLNLPSESESQGDATMSKSVFGTLVIVAGLSGALLTFDFFYEDIYDATFHHANGDPEDFPGGWMACPNCEGGLAEHQGGRTFVCRKCKYSFDYRDVKGHPTFLGIFKRSRPPE